FNLMEEKDVQIKGYKIRLPLDVVIVASANPEDYTSRGRIITPLKDRFDVQIRTHYPRTIEDEIAIMEQEMPVFEREAAAVRIPDFMKEIVAHLTFEARGSNELNQSSGVSVRVTINNYESLLSNAETRSVRLSERESVPRLTDLHSVLASTAGKIELEYVGEDKRENDLIDRLINRAVLKVWDKYLKVEGLKKVTEHFEAGWGVEVSDRMRAEEYLEGIRQIPGLREAVAQLGPFESPGLMAAAIEFVLGGLHPLGYHAVNVLLHAAVCVLLAVVLGEVTHRPRLAGTAALLFAAHPVHTEAVASVVGRAEELAALAALGAWWLVLRARRHARGRSAWLAGAALALGAGVLAKE